MDQTSVSASLTELAFFLGLLLAKDSFIPFKVFWSCSLRSKSCARDVISRCCHFDCLQVELGSCLLPSQVLKLR